MIKYHVVITSIDGDYKREFVDETLENVMLLGKIGDGTVAEVLSGLNTVDMAMMIANTKNTYRAAKIATLLHSIKEERDPELEDGLINKILGGNQQ